MSTSPNSIFLRFLDYQKRRVGANKAVFFCVCEFKRQLEVYTTVPSNKEIDRIVEHIVSKCKDRLENKVAMLQTLGYLKRRFKSTYSKQTPKNICRAV